MVLWKLQQQQRKDKCLGKWTEKKIQITKVRNETGDVITDSPEIKRIIIEDYWQSHCNKHDNLNEMSKFLKA